MKLLRSVVLLLAIVAGAVAAVATHQASAAPTNLLRWMSAEGANWRYCFGSEGWHGNGTAADVFADDAAPCGGPVSAPVYAHSYGYTYGSAYNLLGAAVNSSQIYTNCYSARVDVYKWNPNGSLTFLGREMFDHTTPRGDLPIYYNMAMGGWSWALTSVYLGQSRNTDTCTIEGYHTHQWARDLAAFIQTPIINDWLEANHDYPQFDLWYYIHKWDW